MRVIDTLIEISDSVYPIGSGHVGSRQTHCPNKNIRRPADDYILVDTRRFRDKEMR